MPQFENMKKNRAVCSNQEEPFSKYFIRVCATYLAQDRAGKSHTRRHSEQCSTVSNAEQMQTYGLSLCLSLSLSLCLSLCLSLSLFPCCNCRRQRIPLVQPRTTYGIAAATQRLQQLLQHSSCRHALTKGMASWTRAWMGRACPSCLHLA
jgi:hypothetical protein